MGNKKYFIKSIPEKIDHLDKDTYKISHKYFKIFYARNFNDAIKILEEVKNLMLIESWSDLETCRDSYGEVVNLFHMMQDGSTYFDEDFEYILEKIIDFERANYDVNKSPISATLMKLEKQWAFDDKF